MNVVYQSCCGLDVHKKSITACTIYTDEKGKRRRERRVFGTFTAELKTMTAWMHERKWVWSVNPSPSRPNTRGVRRSAAAKARAPTCRLHSAAGG